jgi:hypothetical protein
MLDLETLTYTFLLVVAVVVCVVVFMGPHKSPEDISRLDDVVEARMTTRARFIGDPFYPEGVADQDRFQEATARLSGPVATEGIHSIALEESRIHAEDARALASAQATLESMDPVTRERALALDRALGAALAEVEAARAPKTIWDHIEDD